MHTHAVSVVHFELNGGYETFESWVGVCGSRAAGQGSVRFLVSNQRIHHRSDTVAIPSEAQDIWSLIERDFTDPLSQRQIAWEREDQTALWGWATTTETEMAQRYMDATPVPFDSQAAETLDAGVSDALAVARETYYRGKTVEHLRAVVEYRMVAGNILAALCRDRADVPSLIALLDHSNHWIRINAAKTLAFMEATEAVEAIAERLKASKPEAAHGFFDEVYFARAQGWDEFSDPAPRYREAFIMALGMLGAEEEVPLLSQLMVNEENTLGIQYRSANALDMLGTDEAIEALWRAEQDHPYHSVRMVAREALWRRDIEPMPRVEPPKTDPPAQPTPDTLEEAPSRFVFIKGDHDPYNPFQMDNWRQAYLTTDSGPTYRPGRNLYILDVSGSNPEVWPLTQFEDGYVADCEVSYEGDRVIFARREDHNPWWHIFEIHADGTGLRQITNGPYHDVHPSYMPNGRILFSTTRLGARDEYHGYLCTGLATMAPDGDDIQVIGFNFGRDAEPIVGKDGKILFTRLELFYARMKTEMNLISAFPDGTRMHTLYGPERRSLWSTIHGGYTNWTASGERHRQLRLTQPRPYRPGAYLLTTPAGPVITQGRFQERFIREDYLRPGGNDPWVITTPYPLSDDTLLVAAGEKQHEMSVGDFPTDTVDLGLYTLDIETGELSLLYNDPETANFEARPLHPRIVPPILTESPAARSAGFTGTLYAESAFITQEDEVRERGKLLRIIEGLPQVTRHMTHTSGGGAGHEAWKNHGGAFARALGVVPLAADGSFAVEVPADRLLHLQVLDSDRRVVGNQTVWMHVRPGENKGCIGCHETPDTTSTALLEMPQAMTPPTITTALPDGPDQLRYRAKAWFKGYLPDEREERQRTVQSINWFGRN